MGINIMHSTAGFGCHYNQTSSVLLKAKNPFFFSPSFLGSCSQMEGTVGTRLGLEKYGNSSNKECCCIVRIFLPTISISCKIIAIKPP